MPVTSSIKQALGWAAVQRPGDRGKLHLGTQEEEKGQRGSWGQRPSRPWGALGKMTTRAVEEGMLGLGTKESIVAGGQKLAEARKRLLLRLAGRGMQEDGGVGHRTARLRRGEGVGMEKRTAGATGGCTLQQTAWRQTRGCVRLGCKGLGSRRQQGPGGWQRGEWGPRARGLIKLKLLVENAEAGG